MTDDVVQVSYEPGDAAQRLGVSASGLRRLAAAYEEVHGVLPRKVGTKARFYPEDVLTEITKARSLVEAGRYASNVEALEALKLGLDDDDEPEITSIQSQPTPQAFALLLQEQRATHEELRALRKEVAGLKVLPSTDDETHGPLVRAALWLERLLRGRR